MWAFLDFAEELEREAIAVENDRVVLIGLRERRVERPLIFAEQAAQCARVRTGNFTVFPGKAPATHRYQQCRALAW